MSSFRTELSIPVNKDDRTFQQRRVQTMEKLQSQQPRPSTIFPGTTTTRTVTSSSTSTAPSRIYQPSSRHFNDDADDIFGADVFGVRRRDGLLGRPSGSGFDFDNTDWDVSDWMKESRRKWDDDIEKMRRDMFSFEPHSNWFGMDNRRSHLTSSPRHSPYSSCSTVPRQSAPSNSLTGTYEFGEDGELHYKVRLLATKFQPEDINVTCTGNSLTLTAVNKDNNSDTFKQDIKLPDNVDAKKIQCSLTQDGVLIVEGPVDSPAYTQVVPAAEAHPARNVPMAFSCSPISNASGAMSLSRMEQPQIIIENGRKCMVLDIPVESDYVPTDFTIKTEANKISVFGKHEVKTANSSSFKEFSRSYEIPEPLDTMSVTSSICNGLLTIKSYVN